MAAENEDRVEGEVASEVGDARATQFGLRTVMLVVVCVALALGWARDHWRMSRQLRNLQVGSRWSVRQVVGEPNTEGAGDIPTAWASETPDGSQEWLLLQFPSAVKPSRLDIFETHNPGAVFKVTAFDPKGREVTVWEGVDPTPPSSARGVSRIPLAISFQTSRLKIYLDSPSVPGWNEIDAVGLVDTSGKTQWVTYAEASSSYGANWR